MKKWIMSMDRQIIRFENVNYKYGKQENSENLPAVSGLNLEIEQGQFVVVIGPNGSGKSTFARLINGLILPTTGTVYVGGFNTAKDEHIWDVRQLVGMVFQNPDNQLVATSVEEDVAFGPENIGLPSAEIRRRVEDALKAVGMSEYKKSPPHKLSGGQKQRVAIAGILAMKPKCIILDEATSMLDPLGRREVLEVLKKMNAEEKITVIHITHHMDEVEYGNRVIVFDRGKVVKDGTPDEVFSNVEEIKKLGLDVPQVTELLYMLNKEGFNLPLDIIELDKATERIVELLK